MNSQFIKLGFRKGYELMLKRILMAFILPSLLMMGTMIFCLGNFGQSTVVGSPIASIICGAMMTGGSELFIIAAIYDYLKIIHEKENREIN